MKMNMAETLEEMKNTRHYDPGLFFEKPCSCCGKTTYIHNVKMWTYKILNTSARGQRVWYYCSYTCYRKGQKKHGKR